MIQPLRNTILGGHWRRGKNAVFVVKCIFQQVVMGVRIVNDDSRNNGKNHIFKTS